MLYMVCYVNKREVVKLCGRIQINDCLMHVRILEDNKTLGGEGQTDKSSPGNPHRMTRSFMQLIQQTTSHNNIPLLGVIQSQQQLKCTHHFASVR